MKKITIFTIIVIVGYLLPAKAIIPVQNASKNDWNSNSYWYYPWGKSGVHKGIDIFAKKGTPTIASSTGIVIFKGHLKLGGNAVVILGPKWRLHYYAHLESNSVHLLEWVKCGEQIGQVGNTGNARGKSPHLHYSVLRLIPDIGEITLEQQGWKRMFYINPAETFS